MDKIIHLGICFQKIIGDAVQNLYDLHVFIRLY